MKTLLALAMLISSSVGFAVSEPGVISSVLHPEEYLGFPLINSLQDEVARFVEPCTRMGKSDFTVKPAVEIQGSTEHSCAGGMRLIQFRFKNVHGVKFINDIDYGYGPKGNKPFTATEVSALRESFFLKIKSAYGLTCSNDPHQTYRASDTYRCSSTVFSAKVEFVEVSVPKLSYLTKRLDLAKINFRINAFVRDPS